MFASVQWEMWRPATCMPDNCFCEGIRTGMIRQPANTLSSLAFVMVAALVLWSARNHRTPSPIYRTVFAIALIVVGLGSAFYHASLTFIGQFADVMGMYFIGTFVILYAYGRMTGANPRVVAIAYVAINSVLAWILLSIPELRRYAFALILLIGLVMEYRAQHNAARVLTARRLWYALALMAIAFAAWVVDITRVVCVTDSLLQGHALWHMLGAAASWQLYRYYQSETAE